MSFSTYKRTAGSKSGIGQIRRDGDIPCIIYAKGKENVEFFIKGDDFATFSRKLEKGTLSSVKFDLDIEGVSVQAIIKEIQYHRTSYKVLHIDFQELLDDNLVTLNIPIKCVNVINCVGVKQGGNLRLLQQRTKVRCLPKDIPACFELDVSDLSLGKSLRIKDIKFPKGVVSKSEPKSIAISVARK